MLSLLWGRGGERGRPWSSPRCPAGPTVAASPGGEGGGGRGSEVDVLAVRVGVHRCALRV